MNSRPSKHLLGGDAQPPGVGTGIDSRRVVAIVFLVIATMVTASLGWAYGEMQSLPDPSAVAGVVGNAIVVYDRTGHVLGERDPEGQYHVALKLGQMGRYAPAATLAAEDRSFYQHGAIDPLGLGRAIAVDVTSGSAAEGGSTITQQLVKFTLLGSEKTISRKVQEVMLAYTLEHRYSKNQILEMYLNRVYYGHGAYGIGSAAQTYFGAGTKAADLSPAQAAFLAGILAAPTAYDPFLHYDLARERELYVLKGMVSTGALTQAEEKKAAAEDIKSELTLDFSYRTSVAPHFVDYVISSLENRLGSATVHQGGLSVYTTIDPVLQQLAEQSVANGVSRLSPTGVNNGDLLAAKPSTGEILAWVGSADYGNASIGGQYDVVTSPRQPGSSFKPYVYEAALMSQKFTVDSTVNDTPQSFGGYTPNDYDNSYLGQMCLKTALQQSRNIPAVETASKVGMGPIIDLATRMGIRDPLDPTLPTAIGASPVTLFDQVQGYQVFANNGTKVPLHGVTKVVDRSGQTIYSASPQGGSTQVLTPAQAYLMTWILKDYQKTWNFPWNRQMASKTGTTGAASKAPTDAWIMAYNPDVVVGSWVGNTGANGQGGSINTYGEAVADDLLAEFINGLPGGFGDWYAQPPGLVAAKKSGDPLLPGTETLPACSSGAATAKAGGGGNPGGGGGGHHGKP
ncbi:MAG TPA: transglycosylase domain-containing protein [Candidatus Dormibacteraeota bacterium]|nr:transglycosylase domain-containing protein [Candidatus Dormibacteraeota bacterium]